MEYTKDEIFKIRYDTNMNRIRIGNKSWMRSMIKKIKRHKFITTTIMALIIFSIINIIMIYNFFELLKVYSYL